MELPAVLLLGQKYDIEEDQIYGFDYTVTERYEEDN